MLKYLIMVCLCLSLYGKSYYESLYDLNKDQLEILKYSLAEGKPYDLSYTLAAIAWKESLFGKRVVNSKDGKHGSFCVYQVLLTTAANRRGYNLNKSNDLKTLKNKLLDDLDFCSGLALEELLYWKKRFKNNSSKYIAGYNAGYKSIDNPRGNAYQKDIKIRINALMRYVKDNNIKF